MAFSLSCFPQALAWSLTGHFLLPLSCPPSFPFLLMASSFFPCPSFSLPSPPLPSSLPCSDLYILLTLFPLWYLITSPSSFLLPSFSPPPLPSLSSPLHPHLPSVSFSFFFFILLEWTGSEIVFKDTLGSSVSHVPWVQSWFKTFILLNWANEEVDGLKCQLSIFCALSGSVIPWTEAGWGEVWIKVSHESSLLSSVSVLSHFLQAGGHMYGTEGWASRAAKGWREQELLQREWVSVALASPEIERGLQ